MTANVSISVAHREDVLRIPNAALRFRPPETASAGPATNAAASARAGARRGGSGGNPPGARQFSRTVYLRPAEGKNGAPTPVQVKTGISDGIFTEVVEGLNEGDRVVTGATVLPTQRAPAASPFGGGPPRRF